MQNKKKKLINGMFIGGLLIIILTITYFGVSTLLTKVETKSAYAGIKTNEFFNYQDLTEISLVSIPVKVEKEYAYNEQVPVEVIKAEIVKQAKIFGNDVQFMLKLAKCESTFNNLAENPISSGEGVYQYLYGTWRETESGKNHISRFDYKTNILEANRDISNEEYFRWVECLQ